MKWLCILYFFTFLLPLSHAETPVKLSLEKAKAYALKHAYEIKNADYDILTAKKKVWETIARGLPQVKAEASYTNALDIATQLIPDFITPIVYNINEERFGLTPVEPQGDVQFFPAQFGQQYTGNYNIQVGQLIFDGVYLIGVKAVKIYVQLSKDKKEKSEIEIKDMVSSAYYGVIVAKENVKILERELANNQKLLYEVTKLYENGFREETDMLQVKLITTNAETKLLEANRALSASKNTLKFLMGMDIDKSIEVTDNVESLIYDTPLVTTQPAGDTLLNSHIDYRYQETNLTAQKFLLKSMYATYLPSISAFYAYRKDAFSNEWNILKDEWYKSSMIGLTVSVPIFKSGMQRAKILQQKLSLKKLENNLLQTSQHLKKERIEAYNTLKTAEKKYENDKEGFALAKTILERTTIKFNEGIANSTELTQQEQQYSQALNAYIYATLNLLNAKKSYVKSIGKL